ncbi:GNAT family N-acetyltransferase [Nannocystis pusilla]|uniref:GNAT family N-acetyltransferase n=1 Tax=Nannocystis pusilla TaxID=889268 RepID=UPI003B780CA9
MRSRESSLRTARTVLRPFVPDDDALAAFSVFGDPVVMRFAAGPPDVNVDATRARLERYAEHQARHGFSKWAVHSAVTGEYLGDAGILHLPATGELELGYRLARSQWGQGLATEIAAAWLHHALNVLGLAKVIAFADRRNLASVRVLQRSACRSSATIDCATWIVWCTR